LAFIVKRQKQTTTKFRGLIQDCRNPWCWGQKIINWKESTI